jgi:hypothetical protein
MLVSTTVRRGKSALIVTLAALAACAEPVTAPSALDIGAASGPQMSAAGMRLPKKTKRVKAHETYDADSKRTLYTFTIDPNVAQNVTLGEHEVFLPARAICDPSSSSYGTGEWDKPCTLATRPITFRAITGERHGHAAIDFEPDVRFAPSSDEDRSQWVILTLRDAKKLKVDAEYSILWWDAEAESNSGLGNDRGAWVDESSTDATLRAWTDRRGNKVSRRLKHFSGYNVTSGRSRGRGDDG